MSTTSTNSEYSIQLQTTQTATGNYDITSWVVNSQNGMTDGWVNSIYQALKTVVPPAGCTMQVSVTKQDLADTVYATGTGSNPITFT